MAQAMPSDLALTFAGCAGRMSAEMEHAWLLSESGSETIMAQRETFASLVSAVMEPGEGRAILAHRIQTKHAHARLLQQAVFSQDETQAERAERIAVTFVSTCQSMLLDS